MSCYSDVARRLLKVFARTCTWAEYRPFALLQSHAAYVHRGESARVAIMTRPFWIRSWLLLLLV